MQARQAPGQIDRRVPSCMPGSTDRYHRQALLPQIGPEGQARLAASTAVVVGCGALGCAQADLLARAGVGHLRLIDRDVVEVTNLQRQTLFAERDVGSAKAVAAADRLGAVNSQIRIEPLAADLTGENALELLAGCQVILDGSDNFETRYVLNDASVRLGVPYVYGGVIASRGMAATFVPGRTPCLRCVLDGPPPAGSTPTCETAGVFGPAVAIVAAQQASDAIKVLLGRVDLLSDTMLEFDLMANLRRRMALADLAGSAGSCRCCGRRRFDFLDGAQSGQARPLCGRRAVQVTPAAGERVDANALDGLADRLARHGPVRRVGPLLKAQANAQGKRYELTIFPDGRAIIAGTEDPAEARAVYARWIGA
ncbi:MAG: sulfur carrier protein ThiS adenylyltransferase [Phycisphaerales bacterium]|nr:MAG: sulfur carrier protein ThiS adenylyltransferase [Phycisphaerales bacterium]